MKKKLKIFSAAIVFLGISTLLPAQNKELLQLDDSGNYCLPSHEFKLGGISFNDTISKVRQILHKPMKIDVDKDLNLETWYFDHMQVEFYNQRVWSVWVNSDKYATPSGFQTGLSKKEIVGILGISPDSAKMVLSKNQLEIQILNCEFGNYMIFKFDSHEKLVELEFNNDIP